MSMAAAVEPSVRRGFVGAVAWCATAALAPSVQRWDDSPELSNDISLSVRVRRIVWMLGRNLPIVFTIVMGSFERVATPGRGARSFDLIDDCGVVWVTMRVLDFGWPGRQCC